MSALRPAPALCPGCDRAVRGFRTVICFQCGTASPTAGYEGLAHRKRMQSESARPKHSRRSAFGQAA